MLSFPLNHRLWPLILLAFYSFNLFSSDISVCLQQRLGITSDIIPTYSSPAGDFENESQEVLDQIKLSYQTFKKSPHKTYAENDILPFQTKDVSLDLNKLDSNSIAKIATIAKENASRFHYITSAAGQWSRGRINVVKALVPYNLKEIVGPNVAKRISNLDRLLATSDTSEIITLAKKLKLSNTTDIDLIKQVSSAVKLPIIACGGVGRPQHVVDVIKNTHIGAVAMASIFHYTKYTPNDIKRELQNNNFLVRKIV